MNSVRWTRAALGAWMVVVPAMVACGGNDAAPAGGGTAGSDGGPGGGGGGSDAGRGGAGGATDSGGSVDGGVVGTRVFDPATLHELAITVAMGDLPTLDVGTDERVRCTVTLDGMTVADAGCRKKGMTSVQALSAKPGFTIKMNAFVSGQKLDGLKKLTVDNAKEDPSLLTGHLSYELYRRAGLPAPRTSHATVTLNGADKGIYVLEESTNADYLETHFGDGSGNLYEGPWDFPKGVSTADLKDEVSEMRTRGDLEALTSLIMNTPDADLATALDVQLDVGRFITNFAVEEALVLWDNYAIVAWNYYLYHVPGGRFVMLTHGVNWPYWHADFDPFDLLQDPWHTGDPPGYLCVRTLAVPALRERYRAELVRVARDAWNVQDLLARIDRVAATLKSRPLTGNSANDLAAHQAHLEEARAFVRDRRAFLAGLLGF